MVITLLVEVNLSVVTIKRIRSELISLFRLVRLPINLESPQLGPKISTSFSYRPKNSWDIAAGVAIINNRLNLPVKDHQGTEFIGFSPNKQVPNLLFETGFTV
jgi:hypothetical protein